MTEQHKELLERLCASDKGSEDFPGSYVHTVTLRNPDGPEAATLIEQQAARIEKLEGAVEIAATIFEEYARLHLAKCTLEANAKADRNMKYSLEMRSALASDGEEQP